MTEEGYVEVDGVVEGAPSVTLTAADIDKAYQELKLAIVSEMEASIASNNVVSEGWGISDLQRDADNMTNRTVAARKIAQAEVDRIQTLVKFWEMQSLMQLGGAMGG